MSRQDANAAFALSSFLQGTNATYIDEIYARYENDPSSVDAEWQEFLLNSFAANQPYDQFVRDILSADGSDPVRYAIGKLVAL